MMVNCRKINETLVLFFTGREAELTTRLVAFKFSSEASSNSSGQSVNITPPLRSHSVENCILEERERERERERKREGNQQTFN